MIPNHTPALSMNEALMVLVYKNQLSPATCTTLLKWLGGLNYILPADRVLNESALYIKPRTQYDILHLYNFTTLLSTHCTATEQSNIIRHIQCYLNNPA